MRADEEDSDMYGGTQTTVTGVAATGGLAALGLSTGLSVAIAAIVAVVIGSVISYRALSRR